MPFIHTSLRLINRRQDAYREGLFKAWDVSPKDTTSDNEVISDGLSNLIVVDDYDDQDGGAELESKQYR